MVRQKQKKPRTYARNRALSRRAYQAAIESDGAYFLKLIIVLLIGMIWVKFRYPTFTGNSSLVGMPIGMIVGFILVYQLEPLQSDRKIWYALLVISAIISMFLPVGIVI